MTTARPSFGLRNSGARRVWALMCLLLFVAMQAAAVSNSLHKAFHPEACDAGHGCVITLLAQGQMDAPAQALSWVAFVAAMVFLFPAFQPVRFQTVDCRQHPCRAPPRF